jgi:hypothetical protein
VRDDVPVDLVPVFLAIGVIAAFVAGLVAIS